MPTATAGAMKFLRIAALGLTVVLVLIFALGVFVMPRWVGDGARAAANVPARKACASYTYPPESLAAGEQGIAWVEYTTGPDGAVTSARISHSSGYARLDAASLAHIRTCHFRADVSHGSLLYKWLPQ